MRKKTKPIPGVLKIALRQLKNVTLQTLLNVDASTPVPTVPIVMDPSLISVILPDERAPKYVIGLMVWCGWLLNDCAEKVNKLRK